ncbi:MAG: hypothetical protein WCJ58_00370 [bacterium]
MKLNTKKLKAFSLVEILLAIGIFSTTMLSTAYFAMDARRGMQNTEKRITASSELTKFTNLLDIYKFNNWGSFIALTDQGVRGIELTNSAPTVINPPSVINGQTISFQVIHAFRDSSGNLATSGTEDPHTRKVILTASWKDFLEQDHSLEIQKYFNDWNTARWTETTTADFNDGTFADVHTTSNQNGELELNTVFFPDWCNPALSINSYDIPGSASPRSVFAKPGYAYLGTAGSTTGNPLTKVKILGVDPPTIAIEGTFNGYTVNDIFVLGNYAFLATTDDNKEVVIVDISKTPYSEVGYFNASGTTDGSSVYVEGTTGYLAQGRYVRSFNLNAYTGSRTALGSVSVSWIIGTVSHVIVKNQYIYAALDWDWYELAIINATNPANMSVISQTSVNNQQVYDLWLSDDGNRVYLGTTASGSENEFFIFDTATKTGTRPVIASVDTNGTTVQGIAVVASGNVAILAGTGGEEYQVYNISDERHPTRCGGLQIDNGIYDLDASYDAEGNAFAYLITGDPNAEFKIIRGGPGGGAGNGYGYVENGTYTSSIFDTKRADPKLYTISWNSLIPANTDLKLQIRASDTATLSGAIFVGPDNTGNTFFTDKAGSTLPTSVQDKRYVQYKAFLSSNRYGTPIFYDISLDYQ